MPPKGKVGTKGQKAIIEENKSTLNFYFYIIVAVNSVYFALQLIFFWEGFTLRYYFLATLTSSIYLGTYKFLFSMAKVRHDPTSGVVIDGGIDLNMESGMAEHMKDMLLLTAGTQSLSLLSNYCWLFLLLAPGRAFYMLWVNILAPWFFAEAPAENDKADDKKARKMERKMKRR